MSFECQKCGDCCRAYIITVTLGDLHRWRIEGREDIISHVRYWRHENELVFYDKVVQCSFLKDNLCSIYDTRPATCRNFPFNKKDQVVCHVKGLPPEGIDKSLEDQREDEEQTETWAHGAIAYYNLKEF